MSDSDRRRFLATAAGLAGMAALARTTMAEERRRMLPPLLHMVYFWLKNPDSSADRDALVAGLGTLAEIPTVRGIHIGVPASTEQRDVVDNSFHVSELLLFDDLEGQNSYQAHPVHLKFVEDCSHLWERVVVRDSLAVDRTLQSG